MHPVLWAFYDRETTMEDLATVSWLDSLAPTPDAPPDEPVEVGVMDPAPLEEYVVPSFDAPPEPVQAATNLLIGDGRWAMYEDLCVEALLSTETADAYDVPIARISLSENRLADDSEMERTRNRTEQVLRLAVELFETSSPEFLFVTPHGPLEGIGIPDTDDYGSFLGADLHWLYVVSADIADQLGRERLLSAPVYETRSLENGGVLLRMYETMVNDDVDPEPSDRLREHLATE